MHDTLELGSATTAAALDIPHVTHGYGPMTPFADHFASLIGSAIAAAGLPDPVPATFAAPYIDIRPPSLRGAVLNPWQTVQPSRPSAGEGTQRPFT